MPLPYLCALNSTKRGRLRLWVKTTYYINKSNTTITNFHNKLINF